MNTSMLKQAGYFEFNDSMMSDSKPAYQKTYQKRVRDEDGRTKYFINIEHWDFSDHLIDATAYNFNARGQFTRNGDTFNFDLLSVKSAEHAEVFFEEMFINMSCEHYD